MIPWVPLAMIFGKLFQSFSATGNASNGQTASGTSFEQHMRHLAQQTGIPLPVLKPHLATFEPEYKGRQFITVLVNKQQTISIGMFSNIRFPVGRIPQAVTDRLPGLCPPNSFQLSTADGDDGSFIIADGKVLAATLTPQEFVECLNEMMLHLALVDAWILEQGYHR